MCPVKAAPRGIAGAPHAGRTEPRRRPDRTERAAANRLGWPRISGPDPAVGWARRRRPRRRGTSHAPPQPTRGRAFANLSGHDRWRPGGRHKEFTRMKNVAYIALSRQMAIEQQLNVVANNLANLNTAAFKGERVLFEEYLMRAASQPMSYVHSYETLRDTREGQFQATGGQFDVAIAGDGYLAVKTPAGTRYTRNGHLQLDEQGRLITSAGHAVLSSDGQEITLDAAGAAPTIAGDGTISTPDGNVLGKLNLVKFKDQQAMAHEAEGLYRTAQAPEPATQARLKQGVIESANVQPIVELTTMIELLRNYQAAQRLIDTDHDRVRKAIERLARVA
jgi:flagellar basal-body rod protein FlgF